MADKENKSKPNRLQSSYLYYFKNDNDNSEEELNELLEVEKWTVKHMGPPMPVHGSPGEYAILIILETATS